MASGNQGIHTLLEAEREAQKIVEDARKYRQQRVKDAETEAEKEIKEYTAVMEADFTKFSQSREGTVQTSQTSIDQDTDKKLQDIDAAFGSKVDEVVRKLIDRVVLVQAEPHRNLKKVGEQGAH